MTFEGWSWFYAVTGEAAAALIGLLFIVTTLSIPQANPNGAEVGPRLFTTPTVVELALVLGMSALALAPSADTGSACLLIAAASGWGVAYGAKTWWRLAGLPQKTHWSDAWFYGCGPTVVYLALTVCAVAAWLRTPHAAYALGLSLLALLMLAIRNAWDLVTWLAPRRNAAFSDAAPPTT